ncbi:30S ribosomal protein S8 [Candidatus Woesearchaeota archaeon]|nr:30S ribosomal protein S8 [Candidatus Woesearchaeota archaeon]
MLNDPLATVLSCIQSHENIGRHEVLVQPASKTIRKVLDIMNKAGYVGAAEEVTPGRGGVLKVNLLGAINKCGVIKPRYAVKTDDYEKFEKRYLPAKFVGIIIVSTSSGVMTHDEAKQRNMGGRLVAYCY